LLTLETGPRLLLNRIERDPNLTAETTYVGTGLAGNGEQGPPPDNWPPAPGLLYRAGQFLFSLSFSSLTRRIVSLNIAGLLALVASILYLSQFRAGLIDARAQSLLVQAEIIAGAIAASATVQTNAITIDPERLLDLKPGESYGAADEASGLDFPINPERVAPVLRTLISPTKTRARIYDPNGGLILDSRNLENVLRFELPPPSPDKPGIAERAMIARVSTNEAASDNGLTRPLPRASIALTTLMPILSMPFRAIGARFRRIIWMMTNFRNFLRRPNALMAVRTTMRMTSSISWGSTFEMALATVVSIAMRSLSTSASTIAFLFGKY